MVGRFKANAFTIQECIESALSKPFFGYLSSLQGQVDETDTGVHASIRLSFDTDLPFEKENSLKQ